MILEKIIQHPQGVEIQQGLLDSLMGLLMITPSFLFGLALFCIMLFLFYQQSRNLPKLKTTVISLLLYYYLWLVFANVTGTAGLSEICRVYLLGESFFNPGINLIPFADGFSLSFLLNILLFLPLGLLCPIISHSFRNIRSVLLLSLGISLCIEVSQLFTLHRATDINDLITNVAGAVIGYLFYKAAAKLIGTKADPDRQGRDLTKFLPAGIAAITFIAAFFR